MKQPMSIHESIKKKVLEGVEQRREELIDVLSKLVKIPSVVGDEGKAQKAVSQLYKEAGLKVTRFQAEHEKISGHEAFIESNLPYKNRPNIIGIKPERKPQNP